MQIYLLSLSSISSILYIYWFLSGVNAQYDVRRLPEATRRSLCGKNTAFCLNACLQKTSANTCDVNTMLWECVCDGSKVPVSPHYFPLQAQQCIGENGDCRNACVIDGSASGQSSAEINACAYACDQKFVCGTATAGESKNFTVGGDLEPLKPLEPRPNSSTALSTATTKSAPSSSLGSSGIVGSTTFSTSTSTSTAFPTLGTATDSQSTTTTVASRVPTSTFTWVSSSQRDGVWEYGYIRHVSAYCVVFFIFVGML